VAPSAQGASILFDGQVIAFAPLDRALRGGPPKRGATRTWSTLIVQGANALAAVGVQRLCGTQNLLMQPLPQLTPCDPIVAGAFLNAEGFPELILDADKLVKHVCSIAPETAVLPEARPPILVIDDSLTTRMLEQSILESAGYEVDLAVSGEDGLKRAKARRYALFLVDVEMPGMDGFTFIERTRADPELRDTPAVLVTSLTSPEHRSRGQRVGAQGYIVKGEFDQNELLGKIRTLVGAQ
jgi:two-component system chemotaxis sensor kinase CheA